MANLQITTTREQKDLLLKTVWPRENVSGFIGLKLTSRAIAGSFSSHIHILTGFGATITIGRMMLNTGDRVGIAVGTSVGERVGKTVGDGVGD